MRVERFSLFFPPTARVKVRRGETEYGIGAIPLGGYVKITGMNPRRGDPAGGRAARLLPPAGVEADRRDRRRAGGEHRDRVRDPVRRCSSSNGDGRSPTRQVDVRQTGAAGGAVLQPGRPDRAVDGSSGDVTAICASDRDATSAPAAPSNGCVAATPVDVVVHARRADELRVRHAGRATTPARHRAHARSASRYTTATRERTARSRPRRERRGMWHVTTRTLTVFAQLFEAEKRKQIGSVVGAYEVTQPVVRVQRDAGAARSSR